MPRMLELIRASAVSSHQMMSAARGALHVPPAEMLEILIYLARTTRFTANRRASRWQVGTKPLPSRWPPIRIRRKISSIIGFRRRTFAQPCSAFFWRILLCQ